jgi:diaminopimelate epimerase
MQDGLPLTKGHAYGNDFLYIASEHVAGVRLDALARELCDRHTGIGADGLIVYERQAEGASMRLFNADGGIAEVSGNGVRVLAALLLRDDPRIGAAVTVHTAGGPKRLVRTAVEGFRQTFRAAMGLPEHLREVTLTAAGERVDAIAMRFGNPQCVVLGPLPDRTRLAELGAAIERHSAFPDGTNVEFAAVEAPDHVRIVIWERGVGATTSSGTGSCAALVAAAAFGGAARRADVVAPGGSQRVEWEAESVYLTGWAELVCDARWVRRLP